MSLLLAFLLGAIAGLRSMAPPALVAWAAHWGWLDLSATPLAWLESGIARWLLLAAMAGELVADKLPFTPNRTRPGPFGARIVSGALAGAALLGGTGGSIAAGAAIGAVGAIAGTLAGFRARTGMVRSGRVPDYVVAVAEDAIAVGGAILLLLAAR